MQLHGEGWQGKTREDKPVYVIPPAFLDLYGNKNILLNEKLFFF